MNSISLLFATTALLTLAACQGSKSPDGLLQSDGSLLGSGATTMSPSGAVTLDAEESAFVTQLNDYRAQYGLGTLRVSATLTQASKWMSEDMATRDYFDHSDSQGRSPFARMNDFGYTQSSYAAENIAAGNSGAQATFTQWKNSPGHNVNMLGDQYKVIGVGRAHGGGTYGWYWTTDFGSFVDEKL